MERKLKEFEVGDRVLVYDIIIPEDKIIQPPKKGIVVKKEPKYSGGWNGIYYTIWGIEEKRNLCTTTGTDGILELDLEK